MHVNDSVGKTEVLLRFDATGAAAARDGLNMGTFKITADNLIGGRLNIGIAEQYKHLGCVNSGQHKYDQEVECRVTHSQATNKALRTTYLVTKAYPQKDWLTAWKALTFSKLVFHSAIWGT